MVFRGNSSQVFCSVQARSFYCWCASRWLESGGAGSASFCLKDSNELSLAFLAELPVCYFSPRSGGYPEKWSKVSNFQLSPPPEQLDRQRYSHGPKSGSCPLWRKRTLQVWLARS